MNITWSVLVCCHNSAPRLLPALQAIARQSALASTNIEVVLVDNNCSDDTVAIARAFPWPANVSLKVVAEPRPGLAYARERGVRAASGSLLCFIDDDNDAAPDYLEQATRIFAQYPQAAFCGGRSQWPAEYTRGGVLPLVARYFSKSVAVGEQRSFAEGAVGRGDFLWGAGMCMRRERILRIYDSGFSPVLTGRVGKTQLSGEDGELTILLQYDGSTGIYSNSLCLTHRVSTERFNVRYFVKLFFGMGLCSPALAVYREAAEAGPALAPAPVPTPLHRPSRLAPFGPLERVAIVLLHGLLGGAYCAGYARALLSDARTLAAQQAERVRGSLSRDTTRAEVA